MTQQIWIQYLALLTEANRSSVRKTFNQGVWKQSCLFKSKLPEQRCCLFLPAGMELIHQGISRDFWMLL